MDYQGRCKKVSQVNIFVAKLRSISNDATLIDPNAIIKQFLFTVILSIFLMPKKCFFINYKSFLADFENILGTLKYLII